MAKRGYKLQEFAAHLSNVNCLRIGRKSCSVLVTGGEDHKVNLWAIGRPNCIMSLSGHTSPVESVTFDSSELLVVAGASNGTVKLWDLEEAKIVRTLAGHRLNCVSVDFHPFGEFFASGSLDTNLKIWDVRRKGSIHTYKGHTRGVSSIRFTPDGRWVVSGGEDNTVKLWDLTAGKLLHDFKCHKGKIRCIDFHPQEFLLATGSTDRTVKFWDLETFELIGSAGPEATGVCSMTFNSDGKTLFCGLQESLKVFSWEPIRCHDAVDVGWSRLADLNICEGKLFGCSLNQTCVAVWAADISQIGPYAVGGIPRTNDLMGLQFNLGENWSLPQSESTVNANMTLLIPPLDSEIKEKKSSLFINSAACSSPALKKNHVEKVRGTTRFQLTRPNVEATIILGNSPTTKQAKEFTKEAIGADRTLPDTMPSHIRKPSTVRGRTEAPLLDNQSGSLSCMNNDLDNKVDQNLISRLMAKDETTLAVEESHINIRNVAKNFEQNLNFEPSSCYHHKNYYAEAQNCSKGLSCMERIKVKPGRTRSLVESWERRERCSSNETPATATSSDSMPEMDTSPSIVKGPIITAERELISAGNDEASEYLMETHELFSSVLQCRLTKLRVVRQFWVRNDIKGAIDAMGKLSDNSVQADVINLLMEKVDIVKLDLCACLLPLLVGLLDSNTDRYIGNALEMLLKLVRIFGPVIHSTLSASSSIGVDLQAEKRVELCNQCFIHLQKVKQALPLVKKKGGFLAKLAQELNLALQDS